MTPQDGAMTQLLTRTSMQHVFLVFFSCNPSPPIFFKNPSCLEVLKNFFFLSKMIIACQVCYVHDV